MGKYYEILQTNWLIGQKYFYQYVASKYLMSNRGYAEVNSKKWSWRYFADTAVNKLQNIYVKSNNSISNMCDQLVIIVTTAVIHV